jgi:Flp pilus assembly protein TadG
MAGLADICRSFIGSKRAVAAIEFAMILPVLLLLFLGSFDAGNAIAVYMKVRATTYTLAAITNQYSIIQSTDMSSITGAAGVVVSPFSAMPLVVTISQIQIASNGSATYAWSYSPTGTAHTQGSTATVPTAFAIPNSYVIFAEVSYTYTPSFGYFVTGPITLADNLYTTPRSSQCISYTPQTGNACSTTPSGGSGSGGSGSGGSGSGGSGSGGSGSGGSGSGGSGSGGSGSGGSGSGGSGSGGSGGGGSGGWGGGGGGSGSGGGGGGCVFWFFCL